MTLTELTTRRDKWLAAQDAVATGQTYSIEGMSVTRVDAAFIQTTIDRLNRDISDLQAKARGAQPGVLRPSWT